MDVLDQIYLSLASIEIALSLFVIYTNYIQNTENWKRFVE